MQESESKAVEGAVYDTLSRRITEDIGYVQNGKEVDFVTKDSAIEVKWQESTNEADIPRTSFKNNILLTKSTLGRNTVPVAPFLALISRKKRQDI